MPRITVRWGDAPADPATAVDATAPCTASALLALAAEQRRGGSGGGGGGGGSDGDEDAPSIDVAGQTVWAAATMSAGMCTRARADGSRRSVLMRLRCVHARARDETQAARR